MSRVYGPYNSFFFLPAGRGEHLILEMTFSKREERGLIGTQMEGHITDKCLMHERKTDTGEKLWETPKILLKDYNKKRT